MQAAEASAVSHDAARRCRSHSASPLHCLSDSHLGAHHFLPLLRCGHLPSIHLPCLSAGRGGWGCHRAACGCRVPSKDCARLSTLSRSFAMEEQCGSARRLPESERRNCGFVLFLVFFFFCHKGGKSVSCGQRLSHESALLHFLSGSISTFARHCTCL